ncbi:hypothetical protein HYS54_00470 [Candidatus Micrarchaeota archaeon]|nr:hypothetical protein [Candidatus Micrarchaeota archaeon]
MRRVQVSDKYWVSERQHQQMMRAEREIREKAADTRRAMSLLEQDFPSARRVAELISKKAEEILEYNPTALVAIDKTGLPTARLIQHYIRRKTGRTFKVYIVRPERFDPFVPSDVYFVNPTQEKGISSEAKLAVVDDVRAGGFSMHKVRNFLTDKAPHSDVREFPVIDVRQTDMRVLLLPNLPSPTHRQLDKIMGQSEKGIELSRHERFAIFQAYKSALDDHMTAHGIGTDKRSPKR